MERYAFRIWTFGLVILWPAYSLLKGVGFPQSSWDFYLIIIAVVAIFLSLGIMFLGATLLDNRAKM